MSEYLNKSRYNESFCNAITEKFPDHFYDQRIVALFYCAIHLLKHFCLEQYGEYVGDTHHAIILNADPKSKSKIVDLPSGMWEEYYALYNASKNARYEGFEDQAIFEAAMKIEYQEARKALTRFKLYAKPAESTEVQKSTPRSRKS